MKILKKAERFFNRIDGAVPAENKCYVLVMFDISDAKKYSILTKLFKRYGYRIQNSVYEGYVKMSAYKELVRGVDRIMGGERFYNSNDRVRIYRMTGSCSALVYGPCSDECSACEENVFL